MWKPIISPDIIQVIKSRRMSWAGCVARKGEMRSAYNILVGKREEKRQLGRHRHRWEDNIIMYVREIGWKVVNWMHLAQHRDK
jgi:hypothetical protein